MSNNWISVKNQLPTPYEWVLISCVDGNNPLLRFVPSVGAYRDGVWCTKESDEFFNHSDRVYSRNYEKVFQVKVTHWMPLPDPPRD
jgi:hypothetical protein